MNRRTKELYKAGRAGVCFFDVNMSFLEEFDWSDTPLGPRDKWPASLTAIVNLAATFPHPAAVFWKPDVEGQLVTIQNLSWADAASSTESQGKLAEDFYSDDALGLLRSCLRGRAMEVDHNTFFPPGPERKDNSPLLLSSLLNEDGTWHGVLAQVMAQAKGDETAGKGTIKIPDVDDETQDISVNPDTEEDNGEEDDSSNDGTLDLRNNKLFRNFAQMLPIGLAVLSRKAEALFVNSEFFKLTTNNINEPESFRSWPESIHEEDYDRVMNTYHKAFKTSAPLNVEFRCRQNNEESWRLFLMRGIEDQPEDGGFLCAVIDITKLKAAELSERREAQEAKERKSQQERFIDMISHEIRNPLSAILHSAEEIKDTVVQTTPKDKAAEILDAVDTILLCIGHQSTLVDDILSFSKLDAMMLTLNPIKGQPKEAFGECLKLFQPELRAKKIQFEYALDVSFVDNSVDWILADLKRIKQVIVNLLTNAIKFTAKSQGEKKIIVGVGASQERPTSYPPNVVFFDPDATQGYKLDSTIRSEWGEGRQELYIMVAIKDTGIGISDSNQVKLFERFRQATPKTAEKYGGSGLGLFISRKLCQLHGGEIGVSSEEGHGSTFGFFFKVRRSEPPTDEDEQEESSNTISEQADDLLHRDDHRDADSGGSSNQAKEISEQVSGARESIQRTNFHQHRAYTESSLTDPDVKLIAEAHPAAAVSDKKYKLTSRIAEDVQNSIDQRETDKDSRDESKQENSKENTNKRDGDKHDVMKGNEQTRSKSLDGDKATKHHSTLPSRNQKERQRKSLLLLVEDNQINSKVLTRQLTSRGFDVTPVYNGQEAVDVVQQGLDPELILMDQEMPILSGDGATKAIRQLERNGKIRHIPILGVSANVREEQIRAMLAAGMDETISKPFKIDDLVRRIYTIIPET